MYKFNSKIMNLYIYLNPASKYIHIYILYNYYFIIHTFINIKPFYRTQIYDWCSSRTVLVLFD